MTITAEQITAGVAQLQSMRGKARGGAWRDVDAHNRSLDGLVAALQARNAEGIRAHAARLDSAAAMAGENLDGPHRKIVSRAMQISRVI